MQSAGPAVVLLAAIGEVLSGGGGSAAVPSNRHAPPLAPTQPAVARTVGAESRGQGSALESQRRNLMPLPETVVFRGAPLPIGRGFSVAVRGPGGRVEPRVERAAVRLLHRLSAQTGIPVRTALEPEPGRAQLLIEYVESVPAAQRAIEDEAYTLEVDANRALLRAATPYGALRGIETFLQLVEVRGGPSGGAAGEGVPPARQRAEGIALLAAEPGDFVVPGVTIRDAPRFPWRGLLLDPGRHHLPVEVVTRNLDAMAAVKLNVLHWHLTEDQGFRVESRVFPKLHELGSDGLYYTHEEIREIVEYARERGIRVVPEFDMPGHATSWFVGYPELGSGSGPYEIIEGWGIQDPAMDPTREGTYRFIDAFIGEMVSLFPDAYFHIGGDEVRGTPWDANPRIRQFIVDNGLVDNHGLQAYFNRRVQRILARHGKRMVGWDEILHPELPSDIVVQSWRGPESLAQAARAGYQGILSSGYYLDLMYPASQHYSVDPLGEAAAELSDEQRARILGGEACMWGEYVSGETIDSRIWPRAAAIAERLWSSASVAEVDDMYRRLEATSIWLEGTGVTHRSGYSRMLERLVGGRDAAPLRTLADVLEPVKGYRRGRTRAYTRFTPLNRLVDATRPESEAARRFGGSVDAYLAAAASSPPGGAHAGDAAAVRARLLEWRDNHDLLVPLARASSMLPEAEALSAQLRAAAGAGLEALDDLAEGRQPGAEIHSARIAALERAATAHGALALAVTDAVRRLVVAAGGSDR